MILITLSNPAYSEDGAVAIEKGTPAPYSGVLFTKEAASDLRISVLERNKYKLMNESLERSLELQEKNIGIQEKTINMYKEQNDNLAKALYDSRSMSNLERIGWFALGIIGTGLAFYGASKINSR